MQMFWLFSGLARSRFLLIVAILLSFLAGPSYAQRSSGQIDPELYQAMEWRGIGPYRGGRVTAVAGIPDQPFVYYMGATGGGLWKTEDAGDTWTNISDEYFKTGSVGSIAVADSDSNVVYVGMGESPYRGVMSSHGDGVYKSVDAGRNWVNVGLEKTRQISEVVIHPDNPDLVYVAAMGSPWAATSDRGIYRSQDGGANWEKVLFIDADTGASGLSMDASNPRILYASMWDYRRTPWGIRTGGPGSSIHRSTDGGTTWEKLEEGLPGSMGKSGISASPAKPGRVWAIIEAEKGGLYRSDDWGDSWKRVNKAQSLRTRAWYYTHVFADSQDAETVYVLAQPMMRSVDGGFSFSRIPTPHGDNHHLWINPNNNQIMIEGNDGGANVSFNAGQTWSRQDNQPTAQFYRVNTDNQFPYRVYAGQQDNSTVSIASHSPGSGIGREHWQAVGGGESAHISFDPDDPTLVYASTYMGVITEFDRSTGKVRNIQAYPEWNVFRRPLDWKRRFNWNAPVVVSRHDSKVIYHAGNVVLKTTDRGQSWQEISPDLTRNDPEKQGHLSGPFSLEVAGPDVYNTIYYLAESPHEAGTLWAGTDDGLVHITRDDGANWTNVTPRGIGEAYINAIEVSPHDPATAYIAVDRHKFNDFTPRIFRTDNYGKRWRSIVDGIADEAFVRVVREDPVRKGLLYAGTETGLYVSFDDGGNWQSLQLDLPVVPVTDLQVRQNDLVASTQGRGFWILDDLSPLQQMSPELAKKEAHLFAPGPAIRVGRSIRTGGPGKNPPDGAIIYYNLSEAAASGDSAVKLEILDGSGEVIRTFKSKKKDDIEEAKPPSVPFDRRPYKPKAPEAEPGMNRFIWDLRREQYIKIPLPLRYSSQAPERVMPGSYQVRLTVGDVTEIQPLEVLPDPNRSVSAEAYAELDAYLAEVHERIDEVQEAVNQIESLKTQLRDRLELVAKKKDSEDVTAAGKALVDQLEEWEDHVGQPPVSEGRRDDVNFPTRLLTTQYSALKSNVDDAGPPVTTGAKQRLADLGTGWEKLQAAHAELMNGAVPAFNARLEALGVPPVMVPAE